MYQQVSGMGAYFAPVYEKPISMNGLGRSLGSAGCGCRGMGDDAVLPAPAPAATTGMSSNVKGALLIGGAGIVLLALLVVPGHWDGY
jgi:hypothetical protein